MESVATDRSALTKFRGHWIYRSETEEYVRIQISVHGSEICGDAPEKVELKEDREWPPTAPKVRGETECPFATMKFPVLWGFKECGSHRGQLCHGRIVKLTRTNQSGEVKIQINWEDPVYGNDHPWKLEVRDAGRKIVASFLPKIVWIIPLGWREGVVFEIAPVDDRR